MRCLLYVSCWLLLPACTSVYKNLQRSSDGTGCVSKFKPAFTRALYKARVNVVGRHISGILMIKAMQDSSTRVVFTSEAGFTFFDFEYHGDQFKVHYIFRQMDKKSVIKTLQKDFALVLLQHLNAADAYTLKGSNAYYRVFRDGKDFYYYITDSTCTALQRMERGSNRTKVVEANLFYGNTAVPDSIGIRHSNFEFEIGLKQLNDDPER